MATIVNSNRSAAFTAVEKLIKARAYIGFPGDSPPQVSPDGKSFTPMPVIGYIHELGSPAQNIPARPFLVPGVESQRQQITSILIAGAKSALNGDQSAADRTFHTVGTLCVSAVQRQITDGDFAPLKPSTVYRRQHRKEAPRSGDKPLIDTGAMRRAVNYAVRSSS